MNFLRINIKRIGEIVVTKKYGKMINLFMVMLLIFGLTNMVYAENPLVQIAVIGDTASNKEKLLLCMRDNKLGFMSKMDVRRLHLIMQNVRDPKGRAPGMFDVKFTIISGNTWSEQLNKDSKYGQRLKNNEYHCIFVVLDPSMVGDGVPNSITAILNSEVVEKIKDENFTPRTQICFISFRDNLGVNASGVCSAISQFALECERRYGDPFGYQDFYSIPISTNAPDQINAIFSVICDMGAGRPELAPRMYSDLIELQQVCEKFLQLLKNAKPEDQANIMKRVKRYVEGYGEFKEKHGVKSPEGSCCIN